MPKDDRLEWSSGFHARVVSVDELGEVWSNFETSLSKEVLE